ncbi:MAG: hypothetical protein J0I93_12015 [Legionella sp.]|nr:hypothetical protein [Legionella sp.]
MLSNIELGGRYPSSKYKQTRKIRDYVKAINGACLAQKYDIAIKYTDKLLDYLTHLHEKNRLCSIATDWFHKNSLIDVREQIHQAKIKQDTRERLVKLSSHTNLSTLYQKHYTSKESFRDLTQRAFSNPKLTQVTELASNNNPITIVNSEEGQFVTRLLRMNKDDEIAGISPRQLRRNMGNLVPQIPQPLVLDEVENDRLEVTFWERSEYFPEGDLAHYFAKLRHERQANTLSADAFDQALLQKSLKIVEFLQVINEKFSVWYTDLKPSNLLLNKGELVLSDIKGLVYSQKHYIESNRTNSTHAYYSSAVFFNQNKFDLQLLQSQTLGTSIYEMACGELPRQVDTGMGTWKNVYNFKHPVFTGKQGIFLKELIKSLSNDLPPTLQELHQIIEKQLDVLENHQHGVAEESPRERFFNF